MQTDPTAYAGRAPTAPARGPAVKLLWGAAAAGAWLLVVSAWQLAALWPQAVTQRIVFEFPESVATASWDAAEWDALQFIVERRVNAELKVGVVHREGDRGFAIDFLGRRPTAVEATEKRLGVVGTLAFRALAERGRDDALLDVATADPAASPDAVVKAKGAPVAEWVPFAPRRKSLPWNAVDAAAFFVRKKGGQEEVLTLLPAEPVDQTHLMRDPRSKKTRNKVLFGETAPGVEGVQFYLNPAGAIRLGNITRERLERAGKVRPRLAVIVEGKVAAVPELTEVWMDSGVIPCDFTKQEQLDFLAIYSYAALPAPLVRKTSPHVAATDGVPTGSAAASTGE